MAVQINAHNPEDQEFVPPQKQNLGMISYSRKNSAFVLRLYQALKEKGIDLWLDTEDITLASQWWAEIRKGIIGARVFIFIATPYSLTSKVCHWELDYALTHKKHIIPIAYIAPAGPAPADPHSLASEIKNVTDPQTLTVLERLDITAPGDKQIDAAANWQSVSQVNIKSFVENESQFDKIVKDIYEAIEHIPEYREQHRLLLIRAFEWEKSERKSDLLLKGSAIRDAERWLSQSANKIPSASPLHIEYITASRRAQNRWLWGFTTVSLMLIIVLTVLAVLFNQTSIRATQEADRANAASTQAIAQLNRVQQVLQTDAIKRLSSKFTVGKSPNRPLLLGTALWVSNRDDSTLLQLRADNGEQIGDPIPVGLNPHEPITDGHYIWVVGSNSVARVDPADTAHPLVLPIKGEPNNVLMDGKWLWLTFEDGNITVIECSSATMAFIAQMGYSLVPPTSDGTHLWMIDEQNWQLLQIDPRQGIRATLPVNQTSTAPVVAGGYLWLTNRQSGSLWQIDLDTAALRHQWPIGSQLSEPLFDGTNLWIISAGTQEVVKFDPSSEQVSKRFTVGDIPWKIFREGSRLWVFTNGQGLLTYDIQTGQTLGKNETIYGNVTDVLADGVHLWLTNSSENSILVLDAANGQTRHILTQCARPSAPVFDSANMWVACRNENTLIRIPALLTYYTPGARGDQTGPSLPVYDGQYLWIVLEDAGQLIQFDADTSQVLQEIPIGQLGDDPFPPFFDGQFIWVLNSGNGILTRIDPKKNPSPVRRLTLSGQGINLTVLGGKLWITSNNFSGDDLTILDPDSLKVIAHYDTGVGAFGPTYEAGDSVAWVAGSDIHSTLYQFDVESAQVLKKIPLGALIRTPTIMGDSVWVTAMYGDFEHTEPKTWLSSGIPGTIYRIRRADGQIVGETSVDSFASVPTFAGGYLWITQSSLGVLGSNTRGILAINPETMQIAASWELCDNVTDAFYDGNLMWFSCINLNANESGKVLVVDPATLQEVHRYENLGRSALKATRFGDDIWITFQETHNAAIFHAGDSQLLRLINLGQSPSRPVYDGQGYVWVANAGDNTVQRIRWQ